MDKKTDTPMVDEFQRDGYADAGQWAEFAKRIEKDRAELMETLETIASVNPYTHSDEGWNEWGEADCYRQIIDFATATLNRMKGE